MGEPTSLRTERIEPLPAPDPSPLGYAPPREATPARAWRVALGLGLFYLLLLAILLAFQVRPMLDFGRFISDAPLDNPFVIGMILMQTIPSAIVCTNVLAVAGYARGALGRSARGPFLVYVLVQPALIALEVAAVAFVVWHGPFNFSTPTGISSVGVPVTSLVMIPPFALLLSLPLVALLFPSVRRACLRRS